MIGGNIRKEVLKRENRYKFYDENNKLIKEEFYFFRKRQKNTKIAKFKKNKFQKIMDCRSKNHSKYLMTDIFTIHGPS